jgi:uncharacterized protein (TIGR00251 family)
VSVAIEIQTTDAGLVINVKAQPGGRKNEVRGEHAGALRISVTQAPEKGKANVAIVEVLCEALKLRRNQIDLIAGETNPRKKFRIREVTETELQERLASAVAAAG